MAFTDWTFLTSGSATASLDSINTIAGTSSLKTTVAGTASTPTIAGFITPGLGTPHGFTRGAIRTLLKPVALGLPTSRIVGVFSQISARLINANAYIAGITGTTVGLFKGAINGALSPLATSAYVAVNGTTLALELEWLALPEEMSATALTVRLGTALDFSNLAPIITYVDDSSPYYISRGEGIVTNTTFFAGGSSEYRFDATTVYRID